MTGTPIVNVPDFLLFNVVVSGISKGICSYCGEREDEVITFKLLGRDYILNLCEHCLDNLLRRFTKRREVHEKKGSTLLKGAKDASSPSKENTGTKRKKKKGETSKDGSGHIVL